MVYVKVPRIKGVYCIFIMISDRNTSIQKPFLNYCFKGQSISLKKARMFDFLLCRRQHHSRPIFYFLDSLYMTSCSLDISGRQQDTDSGWNDTSSAGEKKERKDEGVWSADRSLRCPMLDPQLKTQWSVCQVSWCWNGEMAFNNSLCHTETDLRIHFCNQ